MNAEDIASLCCSFCGKNQREVRKLIAGPTVYICDECIGLCNDIIAEEIERDSSEPTAQRVAAPSDPPSLLRSGITPIHEAIAALRKIKDRLPEEPPFISHAVSVLQTTAQLLQAGLAEWESRARSE